MDPRRWLIILALSLPCFAAPVPAWRLTRSQHFEIYTQTTDQRARAILMWFEQLRTFFGQQQDMPVRIIVFASEREYQPYRLRSTADAYFVGTGSQNYIVMGSDDPVQFGLAAHEYAHLVLRNSGLQMPPWLKEGLAEFFATLRITGQATELGGPLPGRLRTLQGRMWMPLRDLLALSEEAKTRQDRSAADLFYAQSWALTEMLLLSPKYAPGFQKILAFPNLDVEAVTRDLHQWIGQPRLPVVQLPEVVAESGPVEVSDVPPLAARLLLAQLLLAADEFDRAEALFSALGQDEPDSAAVSVGLGLIKLHQGDSDGARRFWKHAIDQGIDDAKLCYHYAILADQANLPAGDIRPALERAVALEPDFDDAHYQLALLEKNAGHYEAAIREFHAMRNVAGTRAYAYWLAVADTFNEMGRRDEARSAARHAAEHATTVPERARADQETYFAETDPGVQFARDASGHLQLVTTRMPHQQSDWNPFIEPGDDIHRVQGTLREIECGSVTTIRVEAAGKLVALAIPDLQHVQMRHAPSEFVCGPQSATPVTVDYARSPNDATDGIVRGMGF